MTAATTAYALGQRRPRRSGITLTEILIAILIMGVGLISLATLFPLGLLRLREGTRQGRAGLTYEDAADDIDSRALFFKPSFLNTWYGTRDPFVQDALPDGTYVNTIASGSVLIPTNNVGLANGLPICYDPLWRELAHVLPANPPNSTTSTMTYDPTLIVPPGLVTGGSATYMLGEARFGSGIFGTTTPYIHLDPDGNIASAHGLQRLTNFVPWNSGGLTPQFAFTHHNDDPSANPPTFLYQPADVAGNVFTSIDDIVYGDTETKTSAVGAALPANLLLRQATSSSPLLPDLSTGGPQADYRFSWFFTGRQIDANGNGAQFTGDVVVCDSRPFGYDPLPNGLGFAPTGETVVEAVYGYGGNARAVLLRWNSALADPPVRVGGWICDTTYERVVSRYRTRVGTTQSSFVRNYWYQVAKRADPGPDLVLGASGYRSMVVILNSRVRTATAVDASNNPLHLNVALVMPSVVNVFNRTFEVH